MQGSEGEGVSPVHRGANPGDQKLALQAGFWSSDDRRTGMGGRKCQGDPVSFHFFPPGRTTVEKNLNEVSAV
jgi:hypothetical protein